VLGPVVLLDMTFRVTVEQSQIPYTADLSDGVVSLYVGERLAGTGLWCLGRIMRPANNQRLGIPRTIAEALERELCEALAMPMLQAA
jgi:hypothetical protein